MVHKKWKICFGRNRAVSESSELVIRRTGGKHLFIDFETVYTNSEVWVNGHYLGNDRMAIFHSLMN